MVDHDDDYEDGMDDDYEDQVEQMIVENGMLIHSLVNLLVRKGVIKQEEIDAEMEKLYQELDEYEGDEREGE